MRKESLSIRIANQGDWQRIIDIYNQAVLEVGKTADTKPVSVKQRKAWLKLHEQKRYPIFIAESESEIVGWCSVSPHRPGRKALEITAEISYYVDIHFRRKGIASTLISKTISFAKQTGIENLFAILLEINFSSINILEKFGFEKWGYLPSVAKINEKYSGQLIYGKNLNKT